MTGMTNHVVVVGLGSLGGPSSSDWSQWASKSSWWSAIRTNRHIGGARALAVPVIAQDATQTQTLVSANMPAAAAVAVLTSDEYANL